MNIDSSQLITDIQNGFRSSVKLLKGKEKGDWYVSDGEVVNEDSL